MPKSESQKAAQKRYVERHPETIREIQKRADANRNRAEYQRERRRRRKLEGRPVPGGSLYKLLDGILEDPEKKLSPATYLRRHQNQKQQADSPPENPE